MQNQAITIHYISKKNFSTLIFILYKVYRNSAPGLPVAAYDDLSAFKIYLVDVDLLQRLAQLAPTAFSDGNSLFTGFKLSIYLLKKAVHKSQNLHTAFLLLIPMELC